MGVGLHEYVVGLVKWRKNERKRRSDINPHKFVTLNDNPNWDYERGCKV